MAYLIFCLVFLRLLTIEKQAPPPVLATLVDFEFENQRGETFGSKELTGRLWVASVVCTDCDGTTDVTLEAMKEVQDRTRNLGNAFHVVSFSVEPEKDSPQALKALAKDHKASKRAWVFLRGDVEQTRAILRLLYESTQVPEMGSLEPHNVHQIVLVDEKLQVRGRYDVTTEGALRRLMGDISVLANGRE